jgi:benzoyl-CoA reductase/2-hydroxyglutaryl-CoA dehydratase subunit BcrC/BadD/HgdB
VALNHGSFLADKYIMVEILESLLEEIEGQTEPVEEGPRILLTGSTLAMGDNKVLEFTARAGGSIVNEEFAEGIRTYWTEVIPRGDLMQALVDGYFTRRIPPGWFRPGKERLDFLVNLARDFNVDGVIWYQLMYRESYKLESYYFPRILDEKTGLPVLIIESDYDSAEEGQLETKIETFVESIRR